jgi:hypothetical protein
MDKPAWIERILSDTQSHQSFLDYISQVEGVLLEDMRVSIAENKVDAARVSAGESMAWKKLRNQLSMYEREEEQNGIIQERRTTG